MVASQQLIFRGKYPYSHHDYQPLLPMNLTHQLSKPFRHVAITCDKEFHSLKLCAEVPFVDPESPTNQFHWTTLKV